MLASTGSLTGTLAAGISSRGSLSGYVQGARGSLQDSLIRTRIESFDGTASGVTAYGFRVELDSIDITSDILSPVEIMGELDHHRSAEFTVIGKQYSPMVTEKTWTRTPVDIYFQQGDPGNVQEEQKFSGYVWTCSQAGHNSYRITCLSAGAFFSNNIVCLDIGPESGLTRGAIIQSMALTAGFPSVDIPSGSVYNKPLSFTSQFWGNAVSFLEPEGWHLRTELDGTLKSYEIRLRSVPDHIWHVDNLTDRPSISPPDSVSSRWVYRGTVTRSVSESEGVTIETVSFPLYGFYNPETTHTQNSSGTIAARDFSPGVHSNFTLFRLIKLIEVTTHKIGSKLIKKIDREQTWVNPASAQYITVSGAGGSGPQGTDFVECFIRDGKALTWSKDKFLESLRREEIFSFDENGTDIGSTVSVFEFFKKTKGVETPAGSPIVDILIGDDEQSYDRNGGGLHQIEGYGLSSRFDILRTYDSDKGSEAEKVQSSYGWYSVRTHNNGVGYLLFNGETQVDLTAIFQLVEVIDKSNIVDNSGRLLGEVESTTEWDVTQSAIGQYDFGQFLAEDEEESFRTTEISATQYDQLSAGTFQSVKWSEGRRNSQTFLGNPPVPRYIVSEWTRYESEPMEVSVDDVVVEDWFGREVKVETIEFALTDRELEGILQRRRSRELSFQIEVNRLETVCEIGDTVMVIDPWQGILHSGILVSWRVIRSGTSSRGTYIVEVPLFQLDGKF